MKATTDDTPQPNTFNVSRWRDQNARVSMTIGCQSELREVIEAFELFLIAIGYSLPDGASLGYEYEDEQSVCACDNFLQVYCDKHKPCKNN